MAYTNGKPSHDVATSRPSTHIRAAGPDDIDNIWAIDSSATKKFGSIPALADLASHEESPEKFHQWLQTGQVYVADESNQIVGFVAIREVDNCLFIEEISTHQDHQGKGVGASMLEFVFWCAQDSARQKGASRAKVSLTTYAEVPWNAPWYAKHGFREVDPNVIGPWHVDKAINDPEERELNRPGYRRCCMLWEREMV